MNRVSVSQVIADRKAAQVDGASSPRPLTIPVARMRTSTSGLLWPDFPDWLVFLDWFEWLFAGADDGGQGYIRATNFPHAGEVGLAQLLARYQPRGMRPTITRRFENVLMERVLRSPDE